MTIMYHVTTRGHLHLSKKLFDCRCNAIAYIKKIIGMHPRKLTREQLNESIQVTRLDDETLPEYRSLYLESDIREPRNVEAFDDE